MEFEQYPLKIQNLIEKVFDENLREEDYTKIIEYCNELTHYGEANEDEGLVGFAGYIRGEIYYLKNEVILFYKEMYNCMPLLEKTKEWLYFALGSNVLGIMSINSGNAPFAMDQYLNALEICEKYNLVDIEWIIHINIGTLYLRVDDEENAINHLLIANNYIEEHKDSENYKSNLSVAYTNLGKAYISEGKIKEARMYWYKLEKECLSFLDKKEKIATYCFGARLFDIISDEKSRNQCIEFVKNIVKTDFAVMDVFDDLYEFLQILIKIKDEENFLFIWEKVYFLTEKTTVKDMLRRLLKLKLIYFEKINNENKFSKIAIEYAKISMSENESNKIMQRNMIALRANLQHLTDINHRVEKENRILQKKSETDALTDMFNRFKLNDYWNKVFENAYHKKTMLAFEILDIDFFKEYNDNYGHQEGDHCLTMVANCIKRISEENNLFCARYGGDEFIIIYPNTTEEEANKIAKDLKKYIYDANLQHKYSKVSDRVTISQGICCDIPTGREKSLDFMFSADNILYFVKEQGKNGFLVGKCSEWRK